MLSSPRKNGIPNHGSSALEREREEIRADEIRGIESMLMFNFRFFRRPRREIYDFPYGEGEGRRVSLVAG